LGGTKPPIFWKFRMHTNQVFPLKRIATKQKKQRAALRERPELKELQVIIKIAEKCNLACTYCYYYFMGDKSFEGKDPVMRKHVFLPLAEHLANGARELQLKRMIIVFHGGEPLLMKEEAFEQLCKQLREKIAPFAELSLAIQTNGVLLNKDWASLLDRLDVAIGVSIDGPKEYHDRFRMDKKSRGSYDQIANNIRNLIVEKDGIKRANVGTLSVMNAEHDPARTLNHFVDSFHVAHAGFLLPDVSWDTGFPKAENARLYGEQLCGLFDAWLSLEDVYVREMNRTVAYFQVTKEETITHNDRLEAVSPEATEDTDIVVIQSTGHLAVDDSLIPALSWRQATTSPHMSETTLKEFVCSGQFHDLKMARETIPTACRACKWKRLCRGGALENRFSTSDGFNNSSIYCEGLKIFYEHVTSRLIDAGYPSDKIEEKLQRGKLGDKALRYYDSETLVSS
jgi:uncharacterized protein